MPYCNLPVPIVIVISGSSWRSLQGIRVIRLIQVITSHCILIAKYRLSTNIPINSPTFPTSPSNCFPLVSPFWNKYVSWSNVFCGFLTSARDHIRCWSYLLIGNLNLHPEKCLWYGRSESVCNFRSIIQQQLWFCVGWHATALAATLEDSFHVDLQSLPSHSRETPAATQHVFVTSFTALKKLWQYQCANATRSFKLASPSRSHQIPQYTWVVTMGNFLLPGYRLTIDNRKSICKRFKMAWSLRWHAAPTSQSQANCFLVIFGGDERIKLYTFLIEKPYSRCTHVISCHLLSSNVISIDATCSITEARVTLYLRGTDATTSLWRYHITPAKSPAMIGDWWQYRNGPAWTSVFNNFTIYSPGGAWIRFTYVRILRSSGITSICSRVQIYHVPTESLL